MALLIFFLLESAGDLLRIESLGDEFIVFAVVLLSAFRQQLDLGGFLLLVADTDH